MKKSAGGGLNQGRSNGLSGISPPARPVAGCAVKPAEIAPATPRTIEVHIEQLVLHGFSHADRRPIADAVERELSSLFAQEGLPAEQSVEIERVNGGTFRLGEKRWEESAGKGVARAIYGGLRR